MTFNQFFSETFIEPSIMISRKNYYTLTWSTLHFLAFRATQHKLGDFRYFSFVLAHGCLGGMIFSQFFFCETFTELFVTPGEEF